MVNWPVGLARLGKMNVQTWLEKNGRKLSPKTKYERLFVEDVISRVEGIDLRFLSAQMQFTDADGKGRECDFVIKEGEFVRIAIEVDGFDKTGRGSGMTFKEFLDWQRRQAALTAQCWHVLRFANSDVKHNPERCAELVGLLLKTLRQKSERIDKLTLRSEQLQGEIAGLQKTREDLNRQASADREKFDAELNAEKQRAMIAQKRLQILAAELKKLEDRRKTSSATSNEAAKELNKRIAELHQSREALGKQNDEEKARIEQRLAERQQNVQAAARKLESLEQELETVRARLSEAEKKSPLAENKKMQRLAEDLGKYKAEIDIMKHTIWAFAFVIVASLITIAIIATPLGSDSSRQAASGAAGVEREASPEPAQPRVTRPSWCRNPTNWASAAQKIGEQSAVIGRVSAVNYRPDLDGQPTWISIGRAFPDRDRFDIIIWGRNRSSLSNVLSNIDVGKTVCVRGLISEYRGVVQLELSDPGQLWFD